MKTAYYIIPAITDSYSGLINNYWLYFTRVDMRTNFCKNHTPINNETIAEILKTINTLGGHVKYYGRELFNSNDTITRAFKICLPDGKSMHAAQRFIESYIQ